MLTTVSKRDVGTAAIVLGLLATLVAGQGVLAAALLVLVGVGLRIEAALRAGSRQRRKDAQPDTDNAESRQGSI
jgi:hypothetical protein